MATWVFYSLLALLLGGLGNFMTRLAHTQGQSSLSVVTVIFLTNFIFGATLWALNKPNLLVSPKGLLTSLLAGVFLSGMVVCLNAAFSQPGAKTGIATALLNANFALVTLLSFFILKETLSIKQVFGLLTILGGMLLLI